MKKARKQDNKLKICQEALAKCRSNFQITLAKYTQDLEDCGARHAAGNRVISELRKEVEHLRARAEKAELHAINVLNAFEATLNIVRKSS